MLAFLLSLAPLSLPALQGPSLDTESAFTVLGQYPGSRGAAVVDVQGSTEIVMMCRAAGADALYWVALRHDAQSGEYLPAFVSRPIVDMKELRVGDIDAASPGEELAVLVQPSGSSDAHVEVWSLETRARLRSFQAGPSNPNEIAIADLDGDGTGEVILTAYGETQAWSGMGAHVGTLPTIGDEYMVVGQMDGDAGMELAFSDGNVVDWATGTVQCNWPSGFPQFLRTSDLDGDGQLELVFVESGTTLWAYDPGLCLPMWSLNVSTPDDVRLMDLDSDGVDELVLSDSSDIQAYETATRNLLWTIAPEPGAKFPTMFSGDADGDGAVELLSGSSGPSPGEHRLRVMDWASGSVEWANEPLDGPLVGPVRGDVDADGVLDYVVVASSTYNGYQPGRILVFDADLRLKMSSGPVAWNTAYSVHDLEVADLDGVPGDEVILATNSYSDGVLVAYGHSGGALTEVWNSTPFVGSQEFMTVDVLDVDGDGVREVVGGTRRTNSGAAGTHVYVYDSLTGAEEWESVLLGTDPVRSMEFGDFDGDGNTEIVAVLDEGDAWIFDGVTTFPDGLVAGAWTDAEQYPASGGQPPYLLLSDTAGQLHAYRYQSPTYQPATFFQVVLGGPLDWMAIRFGALFASSEGRLEIHFPPLNGLPAFETPTEGPDFARWFVVLDPQRMMTTCSYALRLMILQ